MGKHTVNTTVSLVVPSSNYAFPPYCTLSPSYTRHSFSFWSQIHFPPLIPETLFHSCPIYTAPFPHQVPSNLLYQIQFPFLSRVHFPISVPGTLPLVSQDTLPPFLPQVHFPLFILVTPSLSFLLQIHPLPFLSQVPSHYLLQIHFPFNPRHTSHFPAPEHSPFLPQIHLIIDTSIAWYPLIIIIAQSAIQ